MADSVNDDPIRRCTLLVLFQSQQDHATELVIGLSAGGGAAIKYKVGDAWCDWKAPGPDLVPGIVAELSRLAWFSDGAFPKDGTIDVAFSGLRLQWRIRMESTDAECILTPIQE